MKNRFLCAFTTLAVLVLLVASDSQGIAQQQTARQLPARPQQEGSTVAKPQQERPIIEVQAQPVSAEAERVSAPRGCGQTSPDVQVHDVADKFTPPGSPRSLSPALTSFLAGRNLTTKGYDDPRVNMVFADSFRLRSCRICYATLEVGVRYTQDYWINDTITAGVAPFNNAPGAIFMHSGLWNLNGPNPQNPKIATFTLSTAAMNQYIMTGPMPSFLDVIAQDDSDFDYAKLSVWYY
jgi:hypothetical protein